MNVPIDALIDTMSRTFWAMLRIGGFFMVVPVIGSQMVSPRIRMALTFATAIAVCAVAAADAVAERHRSRSSACSPITQVIIGSVLGFH